MGRRTDVADGEGRFDIVIRMGSSARSSLLFAGSSDGIGGGTCYVEDAQWHTMGIVGKMHNK